MMENKSKKDKSIGIVPVFKDNTETFFFLSVLHNEGHWSFPKGHKEPGEDEISTVKRELYEETGIKNIEIDTEKYFLEQYSFEKNRTRYDKEVKYFLGFVFDKGGQTPERFREEIREIKWVTYEDTMELLTFPEARELLKEVFDYLKSKD